MFDWQASRVHLVVGRSGRLADEMVANAVAGWEGTVSRHGQDPDLASLLLGMDTPSLFGGATLAIARVGKDRLEAQRDHVLAAIGQPSVAGALLLVCPDLDGRGAVAKAARAAGALVALDLPHHPYEIESWLVARLHGSAHPVVDPRAVAAALIEHRGDSFDGLLGAFDQACDHAGDEPVTVADVDAVIGGQAERPPWILAEAALAGDVERTLRLAGAGGGIEPERVFAGLASELRKLLALCRSSDDGEVAAWVGMRGRPRLGPARRQARSLGATTIARLLRGLIGAWHQARTGGDPAVTLEVYLQNVRRVIRSRQSPGR